MVEERTFIMIKPDGVQRGLIGQIIQRFEDRGLKLIAMKFMTPSVKLLEQHYADLKGKPFFPALMEYMSSGPVVPMVWEGLNAVAMGRKMLGATKPADSEPGTIRGDFCLDVGRNLCHGSDAVASATTEIKLWFTNNELVNWADHSAAQIYEKPPTPAVAKGGGEPKKDAGKKAGGGDKGGDKKAEDPVKAREKLVAKAVKEGGKKGVELEGASDMGGLEFFCTSVDVADGDMDLLRETVKAMNAEPDPTAEERKGGAGHIGKMVFSAGPKQLIMMATVPEDKQSRVNATEWMKHVTAAVQGKTEAGGSPGEATGTADANMDAGRFPIKMKDVALAAGIAYLKERGCFPDTADDDDDSDVAFGDDAFDDL